MCLGAIYWAGMKKVVYASTRLDAAKAGFDDKGDVVVNISPVKKGTGIQLEIASKVESMFGEQIEASVRDVLGSKGIADAKVVLNDVGALDYVIRARLITAIERATKEEKTLGMERIGDGQRVEGRKGE